MKKTTSQELMDKIKNNDSVFVLDVRATEKYENETISEDNCKVVNIPWTVLQETQNDTDDIFARLPKDRPIVTLCTTGNSATKAANFLLEKGYDASPLEGGITAWNEAKK